MSERVDFKVAPLSWRTIATKRKNSTTTKQWQVTIRWRERVGTAEDGTAITKERRKSKLFPADMVLDSAVKRRHAADLWIQELEDEQERRIVEERRAAEENERAAREEAKLQKERKADEAAKTLPSGRSTVSFYVDSYIDDLEASGSIERATVMSYRLSAKHVAKGFPGVRLDELTPAMVQKWENSLVREGRHPGTILKYHKLLSLVCKHAVFMDDLMKNPCTGVKTPKQGAPLPNSLTAEGFAWLASTIDVMEPTPVIVAAAISLYTGMRQGEICGLRWREYDEGAQTIRVVEAIGTGKGGDYSKAPKTTSSKRIIPVAAKLAEVLERRRKLMLAQLDEAGVALSPTEFGSLYVIGYADGRFHSPTMLCRSWKAMSESFGLTGTQGRRVTFHDLRHSFATRAVAAGADVKAVSSVLGHANAAMTLNAYADADPESKRRTSDLVQQAALRQTGKGGAVPTLAFSR